MNMIKLLLFYQILIKSIFLIIIYNNLKISIVIFIYKLFILIDFNILFIFDYKNITKKNYYNKL